MRIKQTIEQGIFKRMDSVGNSWPVMMMREMLGVELLESNVQNFYNVHDLIDYRLNDLSEQMSEMKSRLESLQAKVNECQRMVDESKNYAQQADKEIARQNKIAASWWRRG